ncbi:hypothetical protein ACJ5NV_20385 [Loktanella agnita]|uniref:hypothetical protein n=1 Tax=Loktanella agnita TaxID=287097 RepID=UPI003989ADE4
MPIANFVTPAAPVSDHHASRFSQPQSRPGFPAQKSGEVLYLDQYRGTAFKHWFATAFASYLRDRFVNPEQVATAFGVRASTAWNCWNGDNKASGDVVARLFMTFPDAGAWFLKSWEGR